MLLLVLLAISPVESLSAPFVERYFAQYPSRATEAGRSDFDSQLEDFGPGRLREWLAFVARTDEAARALQNGGGIPPEDAIDLEVLRRALLRERFRLEVRQDPARNPLFWTGVLSNPVIYLLLRDDEPLGPR